MPQHAYLAPETIQFADDTLIITEANPTTLKVITRVLETYSDLTGLKINRGKNTLVPIAIPTNLVQAIQLILSSPPSQLPIKYLGLPLTVRKPRKIHYQPLLAAVQRKMEGWTSNFLSYGGRVTLNKAVLSAIPLHFMQALKVRTGVIRHVDKMRRNFLWKRNATCKGINCLVNWEKVCALKINGGLGIIDLRSQNDALLNKWLWIIGENPGGLWASTLRRLHGLTAASQIQSNAEASFFMKDLARLLPFFEASTHTDNGLKWRWNNTGVFTCASAYNVMHNKSILLTNRPSLWKLKVPMKVKIFLWLMLANKILTQDVLLIRGCNVQPGCHLCNSTITETRDHLMWDCAYAANFWRGILAQFNLTQIVSSNISKA